jgi:formate-dependent phosphoribosylglycinamide formyltransferase (GAR transformylase)
MNQGYLKSALISVGAGESQVFLIEKMKELGYAVISVDCNPEAPGFEYSDEAICLSTYEAAPVIAKLDGFTDRYELKGVFTRSSGPPVVTTAVIAEHFGLPGVTKDAASVIINKGSLMELCKSKGIVTPQTRLINEADHLDLMARRLPCIVKPALALVGKSGVVLVRKGEEIEPAFAAARSVSYTGEVLLERFVPGDDVGLMSVVFEGKVYPVVMLMEMNEFDSNGKLSSKGVTMPYEPPKKVSRSIYGLAQSIVDAAGVGYGPFLMSCRCTEGSVPVPIEIHLDFGGDGILDELFRMSTDFDFIKYAIGVVLGTVVPAEEAGGSFKFARIGPGRTG